MEPERQTRCAPRSLVSGAIGPQARRPDSQVAILAERQSKGGSLRESSGHLATDVIGSGGQVSFGLNPNLHLTRNLMLNPDAPIRTWRLGLR